MQEQLQCNYYYECNITLHSEHVSSRYFYSLFKVSTCLIISTCDDNTCNDLNLFFTNRSKKMTNWIKKYILKKKLLLLFYLLVFHTRSLKNTHKTDNLVSIRKSALRGNYFPNI